MTTFNAPVTAPAARPLRAQQPADRFGWWWAIGRRKTSTARVRVKPGKGEFLVNERPFEEFFVIERDRKNILAVLEKTGMKGSLDLRVTCAGGGVTGQAGAVQLGIARAVMAFDPNHETVLREQDLLTRDARKVERKKYGQAGARRRFQFSKR
ncbi:MAG: ribosomal protein [Planctomycetota bacterium]|jgi:small subunit ribosomal protein S9|nr:30S ribosomal protein S9 [Planctomycetota bacterium]